eukprot:scaffold2113_cov145-Amphora_coffeaeformis.AAC.3
MTTPIIIVESSSSSSSSSSSPPSKDDPEKTEPRVGEETDKRLERPQNSTTIVNTTTAMAETAVAVNSCSGSTAETNNRQDTSVPPQDFRKPTQEEEELNSAGVEHGKSPPPPQAQPQKVPPEPHKDKEVTTKGTDKSPPPDGKIQLQQKNEKGEENKASEPPTGQDTVAPVPGASLQVPTSTSSTPPLTTLPDTAAIKAPAAATADSTSSNPNNNKNNYNATKPMRVSRRMSKKCDWLYAQFISHDKSGGEDMDDNDDDKDHSSRCRTHVLCAACRANAPPYSHQHHREIRRRARDCFRHIAACPYVSEQIKRQAIQLAMRTHYYDMPLLLKSVSGPGSSILQGDMKITDPSRKEPPPPAQQQQQQQHQQPNSHIYRHPQQQQHPGGPNGPFPHPHGYPPFHPFAPNPYTQVPSNMMFPPQAHPYMFPQNMGPNTRPNRGPNMGLPQGMVPPQNFFPPPAGQNFSSTAIPPSNQLPPAIAVNMIRPTTDTAATAPAAATAAVATSTEPVPLRASSLGSPPGKETNSEPQPRDEQKLSIPRPKPSSPRPQKEPNPTQPHPQEETSPSNESNPYDDEESEDFSEDDGEDIDMGLMDGEDEDFLFNSSASTAVAVTGSSMQFADAQQKNNEPDSLLGGILAAANASRREKRSWLFTQGPMDPTHDRPNKKRRASECATLSPTPGASTLANGLPSKSDLTTKFLQYCIEHDVSFRQALAPSLKSIFLLMAPSGRGQDSISTIWPSEKDLEKLLVQRVDAFHKINLPELLLSNTSVDPIPAADRPWTIQVMWHARSDHFLSTLHFSNDKGAKFCAGYHVVLIPDLSMAVGLAMKHWIVSSPGIMQNLPRPRRRPWHVVGTPGVAGATSFQSRETHRQAWVQKFPSLTFFTPWQEQCGHILAEYLLLSSSSSGPSVLRQAVEAVAAWHSLSREIRGIPAIAELIPLQKPSKDGCTKSWVSAIRATVASTLRSQTACRQWMNKRRRQYPAALEAWNDPAFWHRLPVVHDYLSKLVCSSAAPPPQTLAYALNTYLAWWRGGPTVDAAARDEGYRWRSAVQAQWEKQHEMHMMYLLAWIFHPTYRDAAVGILEASAERYGTSNRNNSLTLHRVIQAASYFWDKHELWTSNEASADEHAQLLHDMKSWCRVKSNLKGDISFRHFKKDVVAFWLPHQGKHPALARLALWVASVPMQEVVPDDSAWRSESLVAEGDKSWYGRTLLKEHLFGSSPGSGSGTTAGSGGGHKFPSTITWSQFLSHWTRDKPERRRPTHDSETCDHPLELSRFWELSASAGVKWTDT